MSVLESVQSSGVPEYRNVTDGSRIFEICGLWFMFHAVGHALGTYEKRGERRGFAFA